MSPPPDAMAFWSLYVAHESHVVAHAQAEIAALAAMTPEVRTVFVALFNADMEVWAEMRENAAQRAAQPGVAPSDAGIEGFIPLPPMTDPTLGGAPFVSDADWADQNRRANDMLSGRNASPQGETS